MKGLIIDRESGDLLIERGGIAIGDTEAQTAEAVIMSMRGEFKEYPLLGGEAARQLAGPGDVMWGGEVRKMLRACGVECDKVTVTPGGNNRNNMKTIAKERQTLADIGLLSGGTLTEGVEAAIRNGLSMSAELSNGQELETTEARRGTDSRIVKRYAVERVEPATEASNEDLAACPYGGIGYMGIEIDFTVS